MKRELAICLTSAKDQMKNWPSLVGTGIFLCLILYIFSELWSIIASEKAWHITPVLMLWYLAITEVVTMAAPRITRAIEQDLKAGIVSILLVRPLGYFRQRAFEFFGQSLVRAVFISLVGCLAAWLYTGAIPLSIKTSLFILITLFLGVSLMVIHQLTIGIFAIWLGESTPLSWLYQKLLFVFGGLMIPLHFYPSWLQQIASLTPWKAMLYGPASLLFNDSGSYFLEVLISQLCWIGVSILVVIFVARRALRHLTREG